SGGQVPGISPSPRADDKLVRVTSGEFIHNVAAVRHYGLDFMNNVNAMRLPRYADGGLVGNVTAANDDGPGDQVIEIRAGGKQARVRSSREQARELAAILQDVGRGVAAR